MITIYPKLWEQEKKKARELRRSTWWKRKKKRGICYYCAASFLPSSFTMDHFIPLSLGGRSIKSNLVLACKRCNAKKTDHMPLEI